MHDQTAMRTEGTTGQFRLCPRVKAEAGEGYRGFASEFPGQVSGAMREQTYCSGTGGNVTAAAR